LTYKSNILFGIWHSNPNPDPNPDPDRDPNSDPNLNRSDINHRPCTHYSITTVTLGFVERATAIGVLRGRGEGRVRG